MAEKIVTKSEFAKLRNVSKETVSRWLSRGKLTQDCLTADGKIRVSRAVKALSEKLSPAHVSAAAARCDKMSEVAEKAGMDKTITMHEAQRLLVSYKAGIKKLEFEEKQGKLCNRERVDMAIFDMARRTRDAMLNIPDRIAAVIAAESDEWKVREILDGELRNALENLAATF